MTKLKPNDFLLYSTGTALAYKIAKEYYNNEHYVWCTEAFDAALQPGTSNPRTLCSRYLEQILKNDRHATEINNNKAGILKGATELHWAHSELDKHAQAVNSTWLHQTERFWLHLKYIHR